MDIGELQTVDHYIDRAIQLRGLPSYSALARHLGVTEPTVNAWRHKRQWPDDTVMTRLADAAEVPRAFALIHLNSWRARDASTQREYLTIFDLMKHCMVVLLILTGLLPTAANASGTNCAAGF